MRTIKKYTFQFTHSSAITRMELVAKKNEIIYVFFIFVWTAFKVRLEKITQQ